jgi:cell fate (sporulation/competence/biofilm development) regulator YlbF (YheA/YmcA/DUF963 family)
MLTDTQQILDLANKLGDLVAQHSAVDAYKKAQKAVAEDAEASRTMAEFDRQLETLIRQESQGMAVTDAQRSALESLQDRIVSNLKVKAMNMAQVEFIDLLRKVNQTVLGKLGEVAPTRAAGAGAGARMAR